MRNYSEFREILQTIVSKHLRGDPVALLFSGGTDSLTVLWTLLDLGAKVQCYTFRLEKVISVDSKVSSLVARTWAVPLQEIIIPSQPVKPLATEVQQLVKRIGSSRKTHVECTWPFLHIAPHIKEDQVWCGLNADDLYGSARGMAIKYGKDKRGFDLARKKLMSDPMTSGWQFIQQVIDRELISPYRDQQVIDYMLDFSWSQLNRPKQKMPAVVSFAKEFQGVPIYRRNDNLQCGSGIREYMARMLEDPSINQRRRKSMRGLYKDFLNGRQCNS